MAAPFVMPQPPVIAPPPVVIQHLPGQLPQPPQADPLTQRLAFRQGPDGEFAAYAEIHRVCNLPIMHPMTPEEVDYYSRLNVLGHAYADGFRFMPKQAEGCLSYEMFNGVFCPIGVGFGKTLTSLMCAQKGINKGIKKACLFVPAQVFGQLTITDIKWARARVPLSMPIHVLQGKPRAARMALAKSGKHGLYIWTYSLLSTTDAEEMLYSIAPELVILDECHEVANDTAAKTRRVIKYIGDHKSEVVALSGTITQKSIEDYHRILRYATRENCPLPHSVTLTKEWANVIDANSNDIDDESGSNPGHTGPLMPLVKWAAANFPGQPITEDRAGFRRAYRLRLNSAPSVVSSGDQAIGTSLTISTASLDRPQDYPDTYPGKKQLDELIRKVDDEWTTPSGDIIDYAIHKWKWLFELTAGFYNLLVWPSVESFAERRRITVDESNRILEAAKKHHAAGQEFMSLLRKWILEKSRPGCDTPLLVRNEIARNGARIVGQELYEAWVYEKALDFDGRPERDSMAVRVCDYKIREAVKWAKYVGDDKGGIVWVYNEEMGAWAYEVFQAEGINTLHCPAGDNEWHLDARNHNKKVIASIPAHGQGKNLQMYQEQVVLQWPRPAHKAEQMLGRTHRTGQKADSLTVWRLSANMFDDMLFAACLNDALYAHQSTGTRQKLVYANYDPLPRIFPSSVLLERGLENRVLDAAQQRLMLDKFGGTQ